MDRRVEMAALLAALRDDSGPRWITWGAQRLLLARAGGREAEDGNCTVIARTRRGYVLCQLTGPMPQCGGRMIVRDMAWKVVTQKRICAIVLERHPR